MDRNIMSKQMRKCRGSLLIVGLVAVGLICSVLLMVAFELQTYILQRNRTHTAVESAALAAAGDLSRIVIKDSKWGYVSLSDHPAAGKATIAGDGEALPVVGVNTLLGTVRLEKMIANSLQNDELTSLAEQDFISSKQTADQLQKVLDASLAPEITGSVSNMNGENLALYKHAREQFAKNFPELTSGRARLISFELSLGSLSEGSTTMTLDPERPLGSQKCYPAFVSLPAAGSDFYFAGISPQPRLIDPARFNRTRGLPFRSALLVEATVGYFSADEKKLYEVRATAVALPFGNVDRTAAGSLALSLPQGNLSEFGSLSNLLASNSLRHTDVSLSRSIGGDYPVQPNARLVVNEEEPKRSLSWHIGHAYFDWLRTARARVRLASAIEALNTRFNLSSQQCQPGSLLLFDFDRKGACLINRYRDGGFLTQTVSEHQQYVMANSVKETEKGMLGVIIRDQVANIGSDGGQHGGQPLGAELPVDYSCPTKQTEDQTAQTSTLRKSSVDGGLAVCIQLFAAPMN